jgi:hypothetical protein
LGRQIINTKRKGLSPRTVLRLVVLAVLLVAIAVGAFFWLHGHAAATAWESGGSGRALVGAAIRLAPLRT